jgi:thiamine biosynthesis protein ThiS
MMEPLFEVTINGETRKVRASSVAGVVEELGLPGPTLLIEHNGKALRRAEWSDCAVHEGDRFEILRVAAGG